MVQTMQIGTLVVVVGRVLHRQVKEELLIGMQ